MRIVVVSDTHGVHRDLKIPQGDIFIHCGDFARGVDSFRELNEFSDWFLSLPHKYKLLVPGNHDTCFEEWESASKAMFAPGMVQTNGLWNGHDFRLPSVFCTSYQPVFMDWAFNRRDEFRELYYSNLKSNPHINPEIMVTHTPPNRILDDSRGQSFGDFYLRDYVDNTPSIRLHLFGHIHGEGTREPIRINNTLFVNASVLDDRYKLVRKPTVIEKVGDEYIVVLS